jgi:hypothetical protein
MIEGIPRFLEEILAERAFDRERTFSNALALAFQPQSFAEFGRHAEFPEAFQRWTQKDNYRGLDVVRIWAMLLNCKHSLESTNGALAELGVYQGQSSALLSLYAEQFGRKLYLCDTFSGFAEEQFEAGMGEGKVTAFKDTSLELAQAVVGGYSGNKWIVGMFPHSVTEEMRADRFAFVSIDCDIFEPIYEGLRFFWPRMEIGGKIFVHDYSSGHWPGATRAVDRFCAEQGLAGCVLPDLAGTFMLARGKRE